MSECVWLWVSGGVKVQNLLHRSGVSDCLTSVSVSDQPRSRAEVYTSAFSPSPALFRVHVSELRCSVFIKIIDHNADGAQ